jgi:methionyl-tRNA formyltransferase
MEAIYDAGGELDLIITLKDHKSVRKSGRVFVDAFAADHNIEVLKVDNINDDGAIETIRKHHIDWLFIIGWSQIAHSSVLSAPRCGVAGMHPTLLPVGRGRAAIPWAILKGLKETGVTLFQLDEGVDTGPIIAQEKIAIAPDETAAVLYENVCRAHEVLIHRVWESFKENKVVLLPQDNSKATEWPGRTPQDGAISPSMTVGEVERLVRAITHPYPGAFWYESGKVIRIWKGTIGDECCTSSDNVMRLKLLDGVYDVLEYVVE